MKKLVTLIAVMLVCNLASGITINWGSVGAGAKDDGGTWLEAGDQISLMKQVGGLDDALDWLLTGDDAVLATDIIGQGFLMENGNFDVTGTVAAVSAGDFLYVRAWNDPSGPAALETGISTPHEYTSGDIFDLNAGDIVTAPIPEPSLMLGGLALLLLRKKS